MRRLSVFRFIGTTFTMAMLTTSVQAAVQADLIILNAKVYTMDPAQPEASAVAVLGNRIVAVGSAEEVRALTGPQTRVIEGKDRAVLPGFNDAHVHFLMGGYARANVDLRSAASPEEMARRLAEYAGNLPKGRWILGGEWDHEKWPGAPLPTRQMIDAATPDHPVFVNRLDGHMVLANSQALRLAGITRETKDPPGGVVVKDPKTGEPTGILKDSAEDLVSRVIADKTFDEKHTAGALPRSMRRKWASPASPTCQRVRTWAFTNIWLSAGN